MARSFPAWRGEFSRTPYFNQLTGASLHPELAECEQIGGLYGFRGPILVVILEVDLREIRG
ncbi:MAG: hypothetical protein CBC13_00550 [Planctomycetia bacterium TMED53]|nr:MAG: hypothetical protein CBC13_00550 [Planctomycetia bacterium TMED53]